MLAQVNSVIIEDEERSLAALEKLLIKYCPKVKIIGTARTVSEGIECIDNCKPDLIFLDIELPGGDGFDILENVKYKSFEVIFTTAYDEYAIKAIEFSALHYLLKPIHQAKLIEAVDRFEHNVNKKLQQEKLNVLRESLDENHKRIILSSADEILVLELDKIVRCEASGNYTFIHLDDGQKVIVSKSLNNLESLLSELFFSRIHSKHLVNLKYVKRYIRGTSGSVVLNDDTRVEVSARKRNDFLIMLKDFGKSL